MTTFFDISKFLPEERAKKAAALTAILCAVHSVFDLDPSLFEDVPFKLTMKGQKGKDIYRTFFDYKGPEEETVTELNLKHATWYISPQIFWHGEPAPDLRYLGAQAQIVACFIHRNRKYRSRHGSVSSDVIATAICDSKLLGVEHAYVEKTVAKMISYGSYYRNIEFALGKGATLALGTDVAETTWTRVLTKRGEKFDAVVAHLSKTPLAPMAQEYSALRVRLVEYQLQFLSEQIRYTEEAPLPQYYNNSAPQQVDIQALVPGYDGFTGVPLEYINSWNPGSVVEADGVDE